jgi:hypothetical protein
VERGSGKGMGEAKARCWGSRVESVVDCCCGTKNKTGNHWNLVSTS